MPDSIISLNPVFAERIISGSKTVELRRRRMHLEPRTRLWLYSTMPVGRFVATTTVVDVHHDVPESLWRRFWKRLGLSRSEYDQYCAGAEWLTAIELGEVVPLIRTLSLSDVRKAGPLFQPPRALMSVTPRDPVLQMLRRRVRRPCDAPGFGQ
jgi:predicted transcriptional regulator